MLAIATAFSRSEKDGRRKTKTDGVSDAHQLWGTTPPELYDRMLLSPSSAISSSSLNIKTDSPDHRLWRRPASERVRLQRKSSNRSTVSEGNKRKSRKRSVFATSGAQRSPVDSEPSSIGWPTASSSSVSGTAASLLRLVLPFSRERRNSRQSGTSPAREDTNNANRNSPPALPPPPSRLPQEPFVPFPQRAPPPVPTSDDALCGDRISVSSAGSSVLGHTYEQVTFCPKAVIDDGAENVYELGTPVICLTRVEPDSLNTPNGLLLPPLEPLVGSECDKPVNCEICIPGEVRAVKRPSRRRKKSRSKGTFTEETFLTKEEHKSKFYQPKEEVLSISLPQKNPYSNSHFSYVDYVSMVNETVPPLTGKSASVSMSMTPTAFSSSPTKKLENSNTDHEKSHKSCQLLVPSPQDVESYSCSYFWYPSKMDLVVGCAESTKTAETEDVDDKDYLPPPPPHSSPDRRGNLTRTIRYLSEETDVSDSQEGKVGCERWRVEGEICRVQEALSERLGTPPVMLRRRDQRLHAINAIEKAIQRLRQESVASTSSDQTWGSTTSEPLGEGYSSSKRASYQDLNMDLVNANQMRGDTNGVSNSQTLTDDESKLHEGPFNMGEDLPSATEEEESKMHPTIEAVLRGTWPFEKALWHSSPASVGLSCQNGSQDTTPGIMSTSSVTSRRAQSQQQLLTNKVEMVYGLLSMFSSGDRDNMSRTLLAMSSSPDSCVAMRQSGCLPLLIQLLHGSDDSPPTRETRLRAGQALHNIVYSHPDDKRGRREARVLRLLEQLRDYADLLWEKLERLCAGRGPLLEDNMEQHPGPAMAALMKLSFDEEHRHAMCSLGGLHAIAELITRDHEAHGSTTADQHCSTLRRYAGMALTNLTFGDGTNKSLLCSFRNFMLSLVSQLQSPSEDLRQVTASVLRNLSWRADSASKASLREIGAVAALTQSALIAKKESTLKVILSAIWNLSAHCSMNKADICNVEGALAFICSTLTYKSDSKTLSIIENGGGILRNISSHIAVRDDLREILRRRNTLSVLLAQLRSPSLTVVSNACGTLWNLSARCPQDQGTLWKEGAVPMLRSLINSKHKMISMGASAALKNLLQAKPEGIEFFDGRHGLGLPSLQARKQKALEQELDPSLSETCDNIETSPRSSPTTIQPEPLFHSLGPHYDPVRLSDSRDSIASTHSDNTHDRMQQLLMRHHHRNGIPGTHHEYLSDRESQIVGDAPQNGALHPISDHHPVGYSKYLIENNVSTKVANLGNKYCNGFRQTKENDSNGALHHSKPSPQVNNFMTAQQNEARTSSEEGNAYFEEDDEPTNFSLRYMEEREETSGDAATERTGSKEPNETNQSTRNGFFSGSSCHEDSLKTFCTEGTPYNFSTAASLTDLREIDGNASHISKHRKISQQSDEHDIDLELENFDDSDVEGPAANKVSNQAEAHHKQPVRAGRAGGHSKGISSTADKPVTYCVEGTPVSLSRISSMSSVSSGDIEERIEKELLDEDEETEHLSPVEAKANQLEANEKCMDTDQRSRSSSGQQQPPNDGSDGQHLQVCNETPLMFSRTTSVSSLSSFDIHSIHDDRSSVVSDFSRMASGLISPSDLPDSPSQTMPSSPKQGRTSTQAMRSHHSTQADGHQSTGIFHDASKAFMEEGTPAGFSHGTSLSSLTFDDEDIPLRSRGDGKDSSTATTTSDSSQQQLSQQIMQPPLRPSRDPSRSSIPRPNSHGHESGVREGHSSRTSSEGPPIRHEAPQPRTPSEGPPVKVQKANDIRGAAPDGEADTEADERRLAALIKSGMPSSKKSPLGPPVPAPRASSRQGMAIPPPPPPPPIAAVVGQSSAIPIKTANLQVTVEAINLTAVEDQRTPQQGNWSGSDSLHNYCTEGTPVSRSQTGSISDLSQLSIPGERSPRAHTNDSNDSEGSADGKKLLEKCIRSGKPKASQRPKEITARDRPVLSPRHSPHHRPVPIARVMPAVKMGVITPQAPSLKSPASYTNEELKTWTVEGTPQGFSPATSVADLTSDSHTNSSRRYKSPSTVRMLQPPKSKEAAGMISPSDNDEIPRRFEVENTPSCLSRHSSLSSIGADSECKSKPDDTKYYGVESTPTLFSHNSSLSSLSVESDETTPREEALLNRCINQGMPKGTPSRIPGVAGRGGSHRVIPGVPMQRLQLSHHPENRNSNIFNQEAESRKLRTDSEESEKQMPIRNMEKRSPLLAEELSVINGAAKSDSTLEDKHSSPEEGATSSLEKGLERSTQSWGSGEGRSEASYSESNTVFAEALKVAKAVSSEAGQRAVNSSDDISLMSTSIASASSICIDQIKPPSAMGSLLSLSTSSIEEGKTYKQPTAKRIECRHTRKMPEMVRRALADQELTLAADGGGSMASSCHSNLDNIFPPSLVEDDMESSMISVASITSEVVEPRDSPPSNGVSLASYTLNNIIGPAQQIANILHREAQLGTSSVTLTAGDEASTCQEITDLDETLAAQPPDGAASDTEIAVDDLPNDIPDLPQDSPLRSGTPSSAKGSPRLTPKTRRSQLQDRYKTVSRGSSSPESNRETPESPQSPAVHRTAKQRRSEDADRFRTRTISCHATTTAQDEPVTGSVGGVTGKIVPVQNNINININNNLSDKPEIRRSFRQRRQEDPSRYQTRTIDMPMSCFNPKLQDQTGKHEDDLVEFQDGDDLGLTQAQMDVLCHDEFQGGNELGLTQAQMEVLSQDANIVICSLNENREAMTMSDTDMFSEENILDIETLSLISNEDEEEVIQLLNEDILVEEALRTPRIVKPGEELPRPSQEGPPAGKAIRGKRKPLYPTGRHQAHIPCSTKSQTSVQPIRALPHTSDSSKPTPAKQSTSPRQQPRATRASTLRHNNLSKGNSSSEDSSRPGSSPGSSAGSSPMLGGGSARSSLNAGRGSKTSKEPSVFKRQNTFTKDDEQSPPERPGRKTSAPTKGVITRARVRKDAVQPCPQWHPPVTLGSSKLNATHSGSQEWSPPRNKGNTQKSSSLPRDAQPLTASEWNSDDSQQSKSGARSVKNDVTSRIASLWKKVEKAQSSSKKCSNAKDDRVWIGGGAKGGQNPPPPNRPLVRSSTFEKECRGSRGRTGLGLKFARLKGRDTRSSPPSEVSTPVESRPQCLVSPTRITPRPRPATHPAATPRATQSGDMKPEDIKEKRLSRLGSFIVVDEEEPVRGRAIVAPFSYRSEVDPPSRASSVTRIPQPSKPLQNNPRDDNGNAALI